MHMKEELNISKKCGVAPPVCCHSGVSGLLSGSCEGCSGRERRVYQPGLTSELELCGPGLKKKKKILWATPPPVFIFPGLGSGLGFKWARWRPDGRGRCEPSLRTACVIFLKIIYLFLFSPLPGNLFCRTTVWAFRVSLNSLKWMEVELT